MLRTRILLVDQEAGTRNPLDFILASAGFQVLTSPNAASALAQARDRLPSLIVLDVALPDLSGFDLCRQLQADSLTRHIPIIILSAQATEVDRILGFESGADDYIAKPFSGREVILRIKKSLERTTDEPEPPTRKKLTMGDLLLDLARHEVTLRNEIVYLTPIEFKLLALLMKHQECALDRKTILEEIWGDWKNSDTRTIDAHIKRLRQKLGPHGRAIETITGYGYRLNESLIPDSRAVAQKQTGLNGLDFAINRMKRGAPHSKKKPNALFALK
jgi:two-component system phosphate regulon response regulator PhoB